METHGYIMTNGKHRGHPITRVPVSYLHWMVDVGHKDAAVARAEIERRGTVVPDIQISPHALDRASLRCRAIWHQTRKNEEGLYSWLARVALAALKEGEPMGENARHHLGIKFCFAFGEAFPSLLTVMVKRRHDPDQAVGETLGDQAEFYNEDREAGEQFGDPSPW